MQDAQAISFRTSQLSNLNRRRSKLITFLIAEASAVGVFVLASAIVLSLKPTDQALLVLIDTVTLIAAPAVFIIVFFAIRPILPRGER